ncbi:prominin-like protein [Orussus abietinus]|uniref:prominin-like protein n=1 Tax=Orussus abietinus TaxID=222816 RepID=UPI000C715BCE|nr:prominin-like protein [Orussus abietinus]
MAPASRPSVLGLLVPLSVCLVLTARPMAGQESLTARMRVISEDLDRQLNEIMTSRAVSYSTVRTTGLPYNASTRFNPKGMGNLYNVTNAFIDFIQSKQAYPEGIISAQSGQLIYADPAKEWRIILTHYAGLTGLAVAGLLVAAILPCAGLFFCCCRCTGRCGVRSEPFDKKHDHCRKVMLSVVLIGVATVILFGVVCAFVTNENMQDGTRELPGNAKISLKDLQLYLTTTKKEIDNLLQTNYNELEATLNNILQSSGKIVTEQLSEYSHAVSLTNLNNIVMGLDAIRHDLRMMNKITQELRANASSLDIVVRGVKKDLLHTLAACTTHYCKQVLQEYKVNQMSVQVDFDRYLDRYFPKLPDVTLALRNITVLMESNIVSDVSQGRESFLKIQNDIQQSVNQTIPVVSASIRRAGDSLITFKNSMTYIIDRMNMEIERMYIPRIDQAQTHIDQYSPYRYYLGLGVSGILLTVLMCLTFGLFCGICGKRPDGYGDDCCNKGSGARFLMMAVWIIFLLTSVLIIVTVAHMVSGVLTQRAICEPLKNPKDNRMFELVDELVQIKRLLYPRIPDANISLSYIDAFVFQLATRFGEAFLSQVDEYLEHVISSAKKTVGKCGPVSNAYNATLVAGCNKILDPFNGFWVSVGWCLVLFIPTIVLCVKLSVLYKKSDPYPGPLVEAVHDKKYRCHGKHHPAAYVESYDGPAGGYAERERIADAHQGSSHHDPRYSDLAPNLALPGQRHKRVASETGKMYTISQNAQNWAEYTNLDPPSYQPAAAPLSAEYERPPPYYFPGPGDRN